MSAASPSEGGDVTRIMGKLECLKEIRQRTVHMEKLKTRLKTSVESCEAEERCLEEYRTELEQLIQEKMAHVEELRLIHQDINTMESVIKQSQEDRNRHLDIAKQLHHELRPLKDLVDRLRSEIGLTKLPEIQQEDPAFKAEFLERPRFAADPSGNQPLSHHQDLGSQSSVSIAQPLPAPTGPVLAASSDGPSSLLQAQQAQLANAVQQMQQRRNAAVMAGNSMGAMDRPQSSAAAAAFRQQPPPMKSCLSCHQQIHRNAPICPLCKAKSRSRNPKRPKRKMED